MILKFFMGDSYNAMSCNHYHVTKLKSGVVEVTLYPTYKSTDGITYRVAGFESMCNIPHFDACSVVNDCGVEVDYICGDVLSSAKCNGGNK